MSKKAVKVTAVVLFLALLAGAGFGVYLAYKYSDGFKTTPKAFYLEVNGKRYFEDTAELTFGNVQINVRYALDELTKKQGFTYKITPTGNDFAYMVDGAPFNYLSIDDVSQAFEIVSDNFGMTLKCRNKTIAEILQRLYPGQEITAPTSEDNNYHFKLVVSSVDGDKSMALTFRCLFGVDGIELTPPSIVF